MTLVVPLLVADEVTVELTEVVGDVVSDEVPVDVR